MAEEGALDLRRGGEEAESSGELVRASKESEGQLKVRFRREMHQETARACFKVVICVLAAASNVTGLCVLPSLITF